MKKRTLFFVVCFVFSLFFLVSCGENGESKNAIASVSSSSSEHTVEELDTSEPEIKRLKMTVVGDLMVHSYQYEEAYQPENGTYEFTHNFQDMKKYFDQADLVIGNLETVFAGEEIGPQDFPCFNTPDSFLDAVKEAGFDILTTANNHCMDQGSAGLIRTLDQLDQREIAHMGTYRSMEEQDHILIKEINGMKLAFLSYTYGTNGIPVPESYFVNLMDEERIKKDLQKAKELNSDLIIVLPHMGNEYVEEPNQTIEGWADFFFENGADLIFASHPHVLQRMERREITNADGTTREGFIIYSLGNFISSQTTPPRNASILLNLELEKIGSQKPEIKRISFVPIWTQFRNSQNENDFVVRSVYERLTLSEEDQKKQIRPKDITRLKEIHKETTSLFLQKDIPLDQIQEEYDFYVREKT
ncbi:MAG: CapA family protein [Clostridiales bacterium]|nr:CapA family protein [Clostridiales bacterium]